MKFLAATLIAGLAILLAGCLLRGTPKTAQAAPAAPKPTLAPAPAAPPPQLSIPQTQVELPPPQTISAEALATTEPPVEEPAPAPATPKPPRPHAGQPAHTEAPAQPVSPPAAEPTERPLVAPLVPQEEQRQLQADAQHDRQEAKATLDRAATRRLSHPQQLLKHNIESFLQSSLDAEKRGDLTQARDFARRALVLAKELQP